MKAFISKSGIFLFVILITGFVFEIALRNIPNDYQYKFRYISKNASEIEILILGNSHSFYAINPEFFTQNTFNCAGVSQSYDIDYEIIKLFTEQWINLEKIIIPISYFSFYFDLRSSPEEWRYDNYLRYWDFENRGYFKFELLSRAFKQNINRIVRYYLLGKDPRIINKLGWGNNYKKQASISMSESAKNRISKHNFFEKGAKVESIEFKRQSESLRSIIQFCIQNQIEVVFILTPLTDEYMQESNEAQWGIVSNELDLILKTCYDCHFYDFRNHIRFKKEDFYDSDHLNERGANKFSLILDSIIAD